MTGLEGNNPQTDEAARLTLPVLRPKAQAESTWRLPSRFRLIKRSGLPAKERVAAEKVIVRQSCTSWFRQRGVVPPPPSLHPSVSELIHEWFCVVDEDGSCTLEPCELSAALKAARIPCNDSTISEMISLMDVNGDGVISWDEFRLFMASEFHSGKSLMQGEYVLPSGLALNFGVMIGKLRRDKLMREVLENTTRRTHWADVASNPQQLAKEVTTILQAAQIAAQINQARRAYEQGASRESHGEEATPRTHAATQMLDAMSQEARLMRQISRQVSRLPPHAERTVRQISRQVSQLPDPAGPAHAGYHRISISCSGAGPRPHGSDSRGQHRHVHQHTGSECQQRPPSFEGLARRRTADARTTANVGWLEPGELPTLSSQQAATASRVMPGQQPPSSLTVLPDFRRQTSAVQWARDT